MRHFLLVLATCLVGVWEPALAVTIGEDQSVGAVPYRTARPGNRSSGQLLQAEHKLSNQPGTGGTAYFDFGRSDRNVYDDDCLFPELQHQYRFGCDHIARRPAQQQCDQPYV